MVNTRALKGIRVRQGYTQKIVADATKINVTTYCRKENGKAHFTPGEIENVASFLDMDIYQVNEVFFNNKLTIGNKVLVTSCRTV